jgi:hypothetical protein
MTTVLTRAATFALKVARHERAPARHRKAPYGGTTGLLKLQKMNFWMGDGGTSTDGKHPPPPMLEDPTSGSRHELNFFGNTPSEQS